VTSKPVLQEKDVKKRPAAEVELDEALEYATHDRPETRYKKGNKKGQIKRKAYVGQKLERDLLRIIANTALERWAEEPTTKLVLIAANAARKAIPMYQGRNTRETEQRYEGYKCATMKVMSIRRIWQMKMDAARKARGGTVPERPKQADYPLEEGKKHKGQYRMFS